MPLIQTSPPEQEPVSLAEAKVHLKVDPDLTEDDALISMLISAARQHAEMLTGRSFITQSWRLVMDSFPGYGITGTQWGVSFSLPRNAIVLERGPVQSVGSIVYTAMDGSTQTVLTPGAPAYAVDLTGPLPRMTPGFGRVWPIPLPQIGAVQVNYTAGYGPNQADVPAGIRDWILMRVKSRYDMRGEVALVARGKIEPLPWIDGLLDPYRVPQI